MQVLVIDDSESIGNAIVRLLREHDVLCVTSAREAMALLVTQGIPFDAIFCDVHMPETSGHDFVAMLGAALPEAAKRVILMSGDPQAASLGSLGTACLPKPFTKSKLEGAIALLGTPSRLAG
jgi:CheY-like chemotaxis protein